MPSVNAPWMAWRATSTAGWTQRILSVQVMQTVRAIFSVYNLETFIIIMYHIIQRAKYREAQSMAQVAKTNDSKSVWRALIPPQDFGRTTEPKCKLVLANSPWSDHKKLELIAPVFFELSCKQWKCYILSIVKHCIFCNFHCSIALGPPS